MASAAFAVGGLLLEEKGNRKAARAAKRQGQQQAAFDTAAAEAEAVLLEERADDVVQIAERDAEDTRRTGAYVKSRAKAVAAASGGGASDKTVLNTMAELDAETEYQALTLLYNGQLSARDLTRQADVTREGGRMSGGLAISEGNARARGYRLDTYGSILKAGASLYENYG